VDNSPGLLQVSRSGYYAARHRGPSDRQKRQVELTARIRTIHQASRESYGAPRVHVELLAQEVPCCRNTVAKLMHKAGILPKAIRRFRVTTDSRRTRRRRTSSTGTSTHSTLTTSG
jgi:transposase InsO family protein